MNPFRWLLGKKIEEKSLDAKMEAPFPNQLEKRGPLVINTDNLTPEGTKAVHTEIAKATGTPIHEGKVEHAYSRNAVSRTDQCPRCSGRTLQQSANFIYATDIAPRVMFAPAGFFCADCPTVIIDEELIASGMKRGYAFQGVVGIDHGREKDPDLFRTWNGEKSVYVLDEDGKPLGISTRGEVDSHPSRERMTGIEKASVKRKRKKARRDRKRNRRG